MTLVAGTRLGPYEIVAPIGAGAMGEVWRARDTRLGRDVAIKVLPLEFGRDAERLARFREEARSASALSDPHILSIFDVGEAAGLHYFAAELIEGATLRDRMADGPMPVGRALDFATQIASGLSSAHEKGIVHRDLKPENILVRRDGFAKIADFGLAKRTASHAANPSLATTASPSLTEAGILLGTIGYMSPEQARGEAVDFRSDQFSLGLILYEMLSGHRAFQRGSVAETLSAILHEEPAPETTAMIPQPLLWILGRCLAKDPSQRYASTLDLAMDLRGCPQRILQSPTPNANALRIPQKTAAVSRWLWALPLAIALGAALALWLRRPESREVPTLQYLTYSGHDSSPAPSPDGKTIAFVSDRDGRSRIWLKQLATAGEAPLTDGPDSSPRFSPDGSTILFARSEGVQSSLYRTAVVGGEPRRLVENANEGDWSPDGARIAYLRWIPNNGGTSVGLADSSGSGRRELARLGGSPLLHPRWSPDGLRLALVEAANGGAQRSIFLVSVDNGGVQTVRPAHQRGWLSSVAWTGSGSSIIYSESDSAVASATGSAAHVVRQNVRSEKWVNLLWSPSGAQILDTLSGGRIVFDVNSVRENLRELSRARSGLGIDGRWLTRGNSSDRQPSYSPDGQWIVFSSNRSGNLDLWEVSTKSGIPRRLTDDAADDWDPGFTPDGTHVLWSSNRSGSFEIWMASTDGSAPRRITNDGEDAENPTMTRDGSWIVYCSLGHRNPGVWKIHPDATGLTQIVKGIAPYPEVSPDGQFLAFRTNDDPSHVTLRVSRLDGRPTAFRSNLEIRRGYSATSVGRSRWMPDGRSVVFVSQDEKGVYGLLEQPFEPDRDTSALSHRLGAFDPDLSNESFGISPDGRHITLAGWDQLSSIVMAEHVPENKR